MDNRSLANQPSYAVVRLTNARVQRVGGLLLSTLDRLGVEAQQVSRIVVYGRRLIVFDLPFLDYDAANELVEQQHLGLRLTHLLTPHLVALRRRTQGCMIIIDLQRR
jgi:hypothetical protein